MSNHSYNMPCGMQTLTRASRTHARAEAARPTARRVNMHATNTRHLIPGRTRTQHMHTHAPGDRRHTPTDRPSSLIKAPFCTEYMYVVCCVVWLWIMYELCSQAGFTRRRGAPSLFCTRTQHSRRAHTHSTPPLDDSLDSTRDQNARS